MSLLPIGNVDRATHTSARDDSRATQLPHDNLSILLIDFSLWLYYSSLIINIGYYRIISSPKVNFFCACPCACACAWKKFLFLCLCVSLPWAYQHQTGFSHFLLLGDIINYYLVSLCLCLCLIFKLVVQSIARFPSRKFPWSFFITWWHNKLLLGELLNWFEPVPQ